MCFGQAISAYLLVASRRCDPLLAKHGQDVQHRPGPGTEQWPLGNALDMIKLQAAFSSRLSASNSVRLVGVGGWRQLAGAVHRHDAASWIFRDLGVHGKRALTESQRNGKIRPLCGVFCCHGG